MTTPANTPAPSDTPMHHIQIETITALWAGDKIQMEVIRDIEAVKRLVEANAALVADAEYVLKLWKAVPGVTLRQCAKDMLEVAKDSQKWAKEREAQRDALVAENAGLRNDKARLDWLEANYGFAQKDHKTPLLRWDGRLFPTTIRAAIDAARKSHPEGDA